MRSLLAFGVAVGLLTLAAGISRVLAEEPSLVGTIVFGKRADVVAREKPQTDTPPASGRPEIWGMEVR